MKRLLGGAALAFALVTTVGSALGATCEREPTAGRHDPYKLSRPLRSSGDPDIRDMPVVTRGR